MSIRPVEDEAVNLRVRRLIFLVLLGIVTASFFTMISNLLMAVFWAIVLAIIFHEPYLWLQRRYPGRSNLNAVLTLLLILIIVIIPVALVSRAIFKESLVIYDAIQNGNLHPLDLITRVQERFPVVEQFIERLGFSREDQIQKVIEFGTSAINALTSVALKSTQSLIKVLVDVSIMLYLLFFFIRDGDEIVREIKRTLPMGDVIEDRLFTRFASVSRATVKGTIVVAIVQGSLGGIIFAILGIPAATLWAVLMMILALIPVAGTGLVWGPAAIILLVQGQVVEAIVLVAFGVLVIGLADNILRPRLVSRDTKMPDYLILLATIGGLSQFGLAGFVIGPVLAALLITCWQISGQLFGGTAEQ